MSRDFRLYLDDILEASRNARSYVESLDFDDFVQDQRTVDAVVRNLEIIGEAVKNLPPELRAERPEIEWKQIARFRDLIAHRYFNVRLTIVWDIVQDQLAALDAAVVHILAKLSESDD